MARSNKQGSGRSLGGLSPVHRKAAGIDIGYMSPVEFEAAAVTAALAA